MIEVKNKLNIDELDVETLEAEGFIFYTYEEATEKFGVNLTERRNRKRNIESKFDGKYEYHQQKKKTVKGIEIRKEGIWIKTNEDVFINHCKTKKTLEGFKKLFEFYLKNYNMIDYLTVNEIEQMTDSNKSQIEVFEGFCRINGLMEKKSTPTYIKKPNPFTNKTEEIEVPTMTQYYYVTKSGQNGKFATSEAYYNHCWRWIYNRTNYLAKKYLEKNPQYQFVTDKVYKGFKKIAEADFNKIYGINSIGRGNSRKIDLGRMMELGIDLEPTYEFIPKEKQHNFYVEPKEFDLDFSIITNDVYDITKPSIEEVTEQPKTNVIEVESVDNKEPKLALAFGQSTKTNFEALTFKPSVTESSYMDGSFLCCA